MIVLDASAAVEMVLGTASGNKVAGRVRSGGGLHYPELMPVEALSAVRRLVLAGHVTRPRAKAAVDDLADMPGQRHGHGPLLPTALALSFRFSPYDAIYVALATALDATLLTLDERLSREAVAHVQVDLPPS